MVQVRKAIASDSKELLKLIKNINEKEKEYLRYDQESRTLKARLLKNIKEDHVILYTHTTEPIGFLEYTVRDNIIWVYSLYFIKAYRHLSFGAVLSIFTGMKKIYKLPIHFAVHPNNKIMHTIARFIKAEQVCTYLDGRTEYYVKEVL